MNFRDVPNLLKFEQYARQNAEDEIVMDCYKRIREIIAGTDFRPEGLRNAELLGDSIRATASFGVAEAVE